MCMSTRARGDCGVRVCARARRAGCVPRVGPERVRRVSRSKRHQMFFPRFTAAAHDRPALARPDVAPEPRRLHPSRRLRLTKMPKRGREAASSTEIPTGDESSEVPAQSITLEVFSAGTLRYYQAMCKYEANGRRHVGDAREGVLKACFENQLTEVTVELLNKLAVRGTLGMPFFHQSKKLPNGIGKAEGSVLTWFKELVTTGELSYDPSK